MLDWLFERDCDLNPNLDQKLLRLLSLFSSEAMFNKRIRVDLIEFLSDWSDACPLFRLLAVIKGGLSLGSVIEIVRGNCWFSWLLLSVAEETLLLLSLWMASFAFCPSTTDWIPKSCRHYISLIKFQDL